MTDKTKGGPSNAVGQATPAEPQDTAASARRAMLKRLGRFAVATPPAVTLLLAAGLLPTKAQAGS